LTIVLINGGHVVKGIAKFHS